MSDSVSRILRTFLQLTVGLAAGVPAVAAALNLSAATTAKVGGIIAAFVLVVTTVQNALEGRTVPTLLAPKPPVPALPAAPVAPVEVVPPVV